MKPSNLSRFAKKIGFKGGLMGQNLELLDQALTHSSWGNENPDAGLSDNENLEFLGDAVLDLIVSDYLFKHSPDQSPGLYTRLRANVVNRTTLARKARELGIGDAMRLGKGEEITSGRDKDSLLADTLEAVIGAQFVAAGYRNAEKMVIAMLKSEIDDECRSGGGHDYKSRLQSFTQETYKEVPRYRIVKASGPDHDRRFDIEVLVRGHVMGTGSGRSKKVAEQAAAHMAMERISRGDRPCDDEPKT